VLAYSFVAALVIGFVVKITVGFRADADAEITGIDETEHAESAYEFSGLRGGGAGLGSHSASALDKIPATAGKEG